MEGLRLYGLLEMQMADAEGNPLGPVETYKNLIVDGGRAWVGRKIQSNSPPSDTLTHLGFGTSTIAPVGTQTALVSEVVRIAVASFITTNLTGTAPYWQAIGALATDQGNTTLGEWGIFNSSAGGTMLSRLVFATKNKTSTNTINCTYTVRF